MINNFRTAIISIWTNKLRSALALLGVVIGVAAVTTSVALGEGLKREVTQLVRGFGTNVIVVVAGKVDPKAGPSNPANFISGDILTALDVAQVASLQGIVTASPISLVSGTLRAEEKTAALPVFGAYPNILDAFEILKLGSGRMFESNDEGNVIVLSHAAAVALFGDEDPVGRLVLLAGKEFFVVGTLAEAPSSNLFGNEINQISLIPFNAATALNRDQVKIFRVIAKAEKAESIPALKTEIYRIILQNHHGEEDFTVLTQDDILDLFSQLLNLMTAAVSAIAAISLIVGGIGIMNIMLVTVTERTREIGIRKAVGATRRAIATQFLVESVVVTLVGGVLGLLASFAAGAVIAAKTGLHPQITVAVVALAVGISTAIGIIFGLWPAMRASRKPPAEALRYE